MSNKYSGSIDVEFDGLPSLRPQLLTTTASNPLERFNEASQRRVFKLEKDWSIKIDNAKYDEDLNGEIVIPQKYNDSETTTDGASVPLPWLVGFASVGILRPLGVMLSGAVVHDFAYKHGGLLYKKEDGTTEFKAIRRDNADNLFRDIIDSVNKLPITSKTAWLAVRLGFFAVDYNKETRTGEFPTVAVAAAAVILFVLWAILSLFGFTGTVVIVGIFYSIAAAFVALGAKEDEKAGADSSGSAKGGDSTPKQEAT